MRKVVILTTLPYLLLSGLFVYYFYFSGTVGYREVAFRDLTFPAPNGFKEVVTPDNNVFCVRGVTSYLTVHRKKGDAAPYVNPVKEVNIFSATEKGRGYFFDIYRIEKGRKKFYRLIAGIVKNGSSLFIETGGASSYSAYRLFKKVAQNMKLREHKVDIVLPDVPAGVFGSDMILFAGILIPLPLIILIFYFSGRSPSERALEELRVVASQEHARYRLKKKGKRQSSFCFVALTYDSLKIYTFMRLRFDIKLPEEREKVDFTENSIIINKSDVRVEIKVKDISKFRHKPM